MIEDKENDGTSGIEASNLQSQGLDVVFGHGGEIKSRSAVTGVWSTLKF
jgi:hypothetical protein